MSLRATDGSDTQLQDFSYPQGTQPGEYRFHSGLPFAFAPGWGNVTPFVLNHSSQFRAGPPYRIDSRKYAADFNEVKSLGGDGLFPNARTPEQTEIGFFWVESSPLAWNRIAAKSRLSPSHAHANARLFGLLNWRWPTAISGRGRANTTTTSGDQSQRFTWPTATAIRIRQEIRPGRHHWDSPIPCPTTTRRTASKVVQRRRS